MTEQHHPLVELARDSIETFVRKGKTLGVPRTRSREMDGKAGAFVSLHKNGQLRGCMGTIEPRMPSVAEEVIANAIHAATRDPRFPPVRPEEVDELDISVDVLSEAEPIESLSQLDPTRYGVIVEAGWRRGLLLPDLEGIDTAEEQVAIARRKALIAPDEPAQLYRFEVIRYH
jgi:AmmeMemoRadiSam system protein A